jgi:mono/diheme cytochrome c family protein
VAYIKSVPPVKNAVQAPVYKKPLERAVLPGSEKPMPASEMANKERRGFYLATLAHCMECHTPETDGQPGFANALGAGGQSFPGPWGVSVARNITSSPTKGLGGWTDAEIKRAITQGISRDGSKLKPPMGFGYYARLSEPDVDAIVAYIRTVPAKG